MFDAFLKYVKNHKVEVVLLVIILVVASFMRLYRIADYMTFLGDEGRDAIIAKDILRGDFTLLGPRASAGDFFLGPIYYYMMAPFLLLSNYDPVGPAIMVAFFGIATVYLVYHVGKRLFNVRAALIAAALYAVSPIIIAYSRSSWNPNPMPFFSLLMLFTLYQAIKKQSIKLLVIVGFLLGIAMQLHYLTTFLAVIIFFFVLLGEPVYKRSQLLKKYLRDYLAIFAGFLVGFSPFLLFELRHGFPNLRTILTFILAGSGSSGTSPTYSFMGNIWDVFYRLFARLVTKYPPPEQVNVSESLVLQLWMGGTILLAVLSVVSLFWVKERLTKLLISLWLFFGILLFGFYTKSIYDYYMGFMFPLPFLLVGNLFASLGEKIPGKKLILIPLLLMLPILILNLSGASFLYTPNKQKDQAKMIAEFVLSKTDGKPFNFALLTRGNSDHVYRYFFETAKNPPVTIENPNSDPERRSVTDQLLIVCEYSECEPLGNPLWEVAGFGRAEIAGSWDISFVKVYKLTHYQRPDGFQLQDLELSARFEKSELGFSFHYPDAFTIMDQTSDPLYNPENAYLKLRIETPKISTEARREDFNIANYRRNTMTMLLTVEENDENLDLLGYLESNMNDTSIDGQQSAFELIQNGLRAQSIPKEGSLVYEGSGGENPMKMYFFTNQNYVYTFAMSGGVDTGDSYTPEAEELFDRVVRSIEFK